MRALDWLLVASLCAGLALVGYAVGYAHGFVAGWVGL